MRLRLQRAFSACYRNLSIFLLGVLCIALAGCATVAPPVLEPQLPARAWQSDELLNSLAQRNEQFRSLRALARVDYAGPDGKGSVQEAVLVQRPDRLRLETITFLGAALIVTVDDKEIVAYHPREGVFVRGERSKENLLRYTQIPLELHEITALLLGLPPSNMSDPWRQEGSSLVFSPNGQKQDMVTFELHLPVPTRWERFNSAGTVELRATFSEYIETPAGLFPSKIQIEAPLQNKKLAIRYQEPELNVTLPPDVFSQQKPAHVKELRLELLGG